MTERLLCHCEIPLRLHGRQSSLQTLHHKVLQSELLFGPRLGSARCARRLRLGCEDEEKIEICSLFACTSVSWHTWRWVFSRGDPFYVHFCMNVVLKLKENGENRTKWWKKIWIRDEKSSRPPTVCVIATWWESALGVEDVRIKKKRGEEKVNQVVSWYLFFIFFFFLLRTIMNCNLRVIQPRAFAQNPHLRYMWVNTLSSTAFSAPSEDLLWSAEFDFSPYTGVYELVLNRPWCAW